MLLKDQKNRKSIDPAFIQAFTEVMVKIGIMFDFEFHTIQPDSIQCQVMLFLFIIAGQTPK